jgi:adenosylmethionine-8-amino-7-oxononanoate aminotransferase
MAHHLNRNARLGAWVLINETWYKLPNNPEAFWTPYTANRQFKAAPRLLVAARDMHYVTADGRNVLDGTAGLWCCKAGHSRPKIVEANDEPHFLSRAQ